MSTLLGHLLVNGTEVAVQDADCSIFVGRLDIDTATTGGDLAIRNIPFPSAVEFDQITGKSYSSVDCSKESYESSCFKPAVIFRNDYYGIRRIEFAAKDYKDVRLHFQLELNADDSESGSSLSVAGEIHAECYPFDSWRLLSGISGPIPIRFSKHYLPMIGIPGISEGATLSDITGQFGQPTHRGGGLHPKFGRIPIWIRYTLPNCYLRFQFENDQATQITIMSLSDPPCDIVHTLG